MLLPRLWQMLVQLNVSMMVVLLRPRSQMQPQPENESDPKSRMLIKV
jgi:hypothetical protein